MARVITSLCLREGSCATVCPVECIVPGNPQNKYPTYYIDADTCIDCGACESECPYGAIFSDLDVPSQYKAKDGQVQQKPAGTEGYTEEYDGMDHDQNPIHLASTRTLKTGDVLDLTPDIQANIDFFKNGPGYKAAK